MAYELHKLGTQGNPILPEGPIESVSTKEDADAFINKRISDEGLDWRSEYAFKTRMMPEPMAFFDSRGILIRYD